MKPIAVIIFFSFHLLVNSVYYVNTNNQRNSPNGTEDNPFSSLKQAIDNLGSGGVFEIILLGENVTVVSTLSFLKDSHYIIKGPHNSTRDYYPLIFQGKEAKMLVSNSSLTLEGVEIVAQNSDDYIDNAVLKIIDGTLILNKSLIQNIDNSQFWWLGPVILVDASDSEVLITNSKLLWLNKALFAFENSWVSVVGSLFNYISNGLFRFEGCKTVNLKNNFFENIAFQSLFMLKYVDFVSLQDFTIQSRDSNFLTSGLLSGNGVSTAEITNGIINNVSIFFSIGASKIIKVHNVAVRNAHDVNFFFWGDPTGKVFVSLSDILLENHESCFFQTTGALAVMLENITMINVSPDENSMSVIDNFYIFDSGVVIAKKIFAINRVNSFLSVSGVQKIVLDDIHLTNNSIPIEYIVKIDMTNINLGSSNNEEVVILVRNLYFDSNKKDRAVSNADLVSPALISLNVKSGKIKIEDFKCPDLSMICIQAYSADILEIHNVVVKAESESPESEISLPKIFQLENLNEIRVLNLYFYNIRNAILFEFQQDDINYPLNITFENLRMTNIALMFDETLMNYPGLFYFSDSNTPRIKFTCKNSFFKNIKTRSGIFTIEGSINIQLFLWNNVFENIYNPESGSILRADFTFSEDLNYFELIGNIFLNSFSGGDGGLFYFFSSNFNITAVDNVYKNISAAGSGGVWYASETELLCTERNGSYLDNFASESGGSWYVRSIWNSKTKSEFYFRDTVFLRAKASENGGAVNIGEVIMSIFNCSFQENKALRLGGDIYMQKSTSVSIQNSSFQKSSAAKGAWIYAKEGQMLNFESIKVFNVDSNAQDSNLMNMNSETITLSNSQFIDISVPLFSFDKTNITFKSVKINNIICTTLESFCLLRGVAKNFTLLDSIIDNITSNTDLINLDSFETVILDNIELSNLKTTQSSDKSLFALKLNLSNQIVIQNSKFSQLGISGIFVKDSSLQLKKSFFSNVNLQYRILQTNNQLQQEASIVFLTMESSNSWISGTMFSSDTAKTNSSIRALQLVGNKGNHHIDGAIFRGGAAPNGGALSVEGQIDLVSITNCDFINNTASVNGGSIYFSDDQKIQSSVIINQSKFTNNTAQRGGAIYLGGYNASLDSSAFMKNVAIEGGAIASYAKDNLSKIKIHKNNFTENYAHIGSALMAFGEINFDIFDSLFLNNQAKYGEDITTQPYYLKLQIYEFDETFLFLKNITPQILMAHSATKLVFDQDSQNLDRGFPLLTQRSGKSPNYLFVFNVLDQLNQNIIVTHLSPLTVKIKDSVSQGDIQPSLLGTTIFNFGENSGVLYIFDSLQVRGTKDTIVTLSAEFTYQHSLSNKDVSLKSAEWKVQIVPCSPGEIYDKTNEICLPCEEGTYSLEDPYIAKSCKECSGPLICKGSNIIFPQSGYWKISKDSDNVVMCPSEEACLGGEKAEGTDFSFTGFCKEGYEGIACANCISGYAKFGNYVASQECKNCNTEVLYYVKFVGFLLIQIIQIILLIRGLLARNSKIGSKVLLTSILNITTIKIIIDFIHTLNLTRDFLPRWPKMIDILLYSLTKIVPDLIDSFSIDCFIALVNGENKNIFFIKLLIMVLEPVFLTTFAIGILMGSYKLQARKIWKNVQFISDILTMMIVIIYLIQPYIIKATFQLFNCSNFGSTSLPRYYMMEDTNIECWKSEHLTWALGLGLPSLALWLVAPSFLLIAMIRDFKNMPNDKFMKKYGLIFIGYRLDSFYWEVLIFSKKVALIILCVFLANGYLKVFLGFLVVSLAYYLQANFRPFSHPELNLTEQLGLLASAFIFYSGLLYTKDNNSAIIINLSMATNTILATSFFGHSLFTISKSFKKKRSNSDLEQMKPRNVTTQSTHSEFLRTLVKEGTVSKRNTILSPIILDLKPIEKELVSSPRSDLLSVESPINQPESPMFSFKNNDRRESQQEKIEFFEELEIWKSEKYESIITEEHSPEDKESIRFVSRSLLKKNKFTKIQKVEIIESPNEMTEDDDDEDLDEHK